MARPSGTHHGPLMPASTMDERLTKMTSSNEHPIIPHSCPELAMSMRIQVQKSEGCLKPREVLGHGTLNSVEANGGESLTLVEMI